MRGKQVEKQRKHKHRKKQAEACLRKIHYSSIEEAIQAAYHTGKGKGRGLQAYPCGDHWHIGHSASINNFGRR